MLCFPWSAIVSSPPLLPFQFSSWLSPSQVLEWPLRYNNITLGDPVVCLYIGLLRMQLPMVMWHASRKTPKPRWVFYTLYTVSGLLWDHYSVLVSIEVAAGAGALVAPLVSTQFSQLSRWSFQYLISAGIALSNVITLYAVFRLKSQDGLLPFLTVGGFISANLTR